MECEHEIRKYLNEEEILQSEKEKRRKHGEQKRAKRRKRLRAKEIERKTIN